jgi:hypothetical protein
LQHAWLHRCDPYPFEVVLSGLTFNSPDTEAPVATFYFRQKGILTKQSEYILTAEDDLDQSTWHFAPSSPSGPVGQGQSVTYHLENSTLVATCAGNTSLCTSGSFKETEFLSFALTNSADQATVNLRVVDKNWFSGKSENAPSFLLKEVQPDGSFGEIVVRTAVTQPGHCTLLKLCAISATAESLAPIGLTLMKQNEYSKVCTTPNSN